MRFQRYLLLILVGLSPWILQVHGSTQQNFDSDIAKADNFYYQGQFSEALALLSPLDESLAKNIRSIADQARVKMLLGLTQIALGDTDKARASFVKFCAVSPDYVLDELQYPRKVVTVFKEAQQDCSKCAQICARGDSAPAETEYCACTSRAFARDESDLAPGRALLAQGKYPEALTEFQKALDNVPGSAARQEAVRTAQQKMESSVELAIKEWRELFLAREFERAAGAYDRILTLGKDAMGPVKNEILQISVRYQTTFQDLATSWDAACSRNDRVALKTFSDWGNALDPNKTIQPAVLNRMKECTSAALPKGNAAK